MLRAEACEPSVHITRARVRMVHSQERSLLEQAIRHFPTFAKFYLMLGQLEERLEHTDAARVAYRCAPELGLRGRVWSAPACGEQPQGQRTGGRARWGLVDDLTSCDASRERDRVMWDAGVLLLLPVSAGTACSSA